MAVDVRAFLKATLDQANTESWALQESGYVPSERSTGLSGLIDSVQSGVSSGTAGLMGSLAAYSAENDWDWLENNATWAGRGLQRIAKANGYRGGEGGFWDVANGVAQTIGTSAPSLAAGLAARAGTAAAGAAVGSAFGGVGAIPGAIAGFAVGTAADAGANDLINSGQMYFDSLDKGLSKEQALANYNQALTDNIPSSLLGAVGDQVSMGFVKAGGKVLGAFANGGGKVAASQAAKAGVNVAIGSALEGHQEAWEDKIANNILEPGSMDNVNMMDPTTWTDEMWGDAKMAALSSGILGGAAHGIRAMANRGSNSATPTIEESIQPELESTSTPTVSDTMETPSVDGVTIPDAPIDLTTDAMDVNLGSIEPEVLAPKEVSDFAPVLDAMNSRFEKNGYSPEDITAKNEAVAMTAQQISDLWDNSDSAKDITKVKRDAFVSDFENAGLTKPEATEASRKLHKLLLDKQANVDTKPVFEGSSLVEKADSLGVNLTEAERNDLLGENPTPSNVREIDELLTKAAYEENQNRYKRQLQEQELANRADYSNRYQNNESFGSNYFNTRFPENRAEETSYRFSKAMAERKKDMEAGKPNSKTNQLIPYLNRNGITTKEYSKQEISDINAYAKTIDKAKQQVDNGAEISGGLQRVARDTASIQNMDRQTTKILSQFDEASKPQETMEKATMLAKALSNVQKKTGLDISKTKAYKAIRALKDKTAYNIIKPQKVKTAQPVNNQTVQPTVSDKIKDVQAQAKPTNENQKVEPVTATNIDEDEITGYEDFNSAIPKIDSIEGLKRSLSASDGVIDVSPEENTTQINETVDSEPKNEPIKEGKKERSYSIKDKHNIVYDFVDGHITATEAKKHLTTLMKSNRTSKKEIQYLKKLESYIDRNIDKENDMYKSRSGVGLDKMKNKINEMINKLKGDIDTGKVTQKKYEDSVKNIERAIDTFYSTYPKTLDTHYFEIPEKHKMNQEALAEATLNGEVEIPSYVKNAIIKTPSKIDELTLRWMNKELDRNDTSFRLGVRNKIIYRVLSNEYAKVMEVGPDNMMVTHPRDVQGLAYAIAGSFPDNSMPGKGAEAQKSRHKAMFPNNPQALRSVGNSDKAGMIAFARKYFAGKFNPEKTEVVEKFNPQKEEKKKEISPFTISSVKVPKAGSDEVHVTIKYTPSKELTDQFVKDNIDSLVGQKLEDAFLDAEPENMTVTSVGNGTIEITTIPSLSYKEFGDKHSSGDNKGNMYDKDVRDARDISLEIAVNAANGEAVAFGNDNLNYKEVQTKLDKVFGKGKYNVVSDSDGNNYIKSADKQLTDEMKDNAMFFQYGKDEQRKSTKKADKEEVAVAKDVVEKNDGELKLSNEFSRNIANSIKHFMGDYAGAVFNYLKKAKHLRIRRVSDSNKNYNGLSLLNHGIIEMNEKALTDTSSMPLHELVHDAVYTITNGGEVKNGKQLHTWLSDVIDQAKEEIEHGISTEVRLAGGTGSAVYGRDGDAIQRLRMSGGGTGGIHVPNDGHVVSSDGAWQSHESNRSGESGTQTNESGEVGIRANGELVEESRLDGRIEEYPGNPQLEGRNGAIYQRGFRRQSRRWASAKNLVDKTTDKNKDISFKRIKGNIEELLDDHEMYHTEKAHAILSNLWAAREIDKKLGFKKNSKDKLYTRLTENPPTPESNKKFSTIFQEAIAYASHTIAKPAKVAELFNLAQQSGYLRTLSDSDKTLSQIGKEDPVRDVKVVATEMIEGAKEALKMKRDSNINIKTRDMKPGNIPSAWVKKFFASPAKLIKKYISDTSPMIRWAEQAEVEKDKLRRKYIKRWESIHNKLSDENKNKFFQVLKDMTELGREYMQTMRVDYKGRDVFINISDKDTFFESPELDEAQKTYNELKNSGKNSYMDFKDGMFRVFGSDNEIRPYSSFESASKIAKAQTDAIMKAKGYSDTVVKAYGDYRNLMTSIYKDSMDAWHKTGEDPDTKPRYLYAYTPMLHSRYGVYVVTEHEHNGKVYNQYDKVASFHNIPDAKRWARELNVKGNQRIDIIQHGTRFDDTTSAADLYDGYSYDEKYDDVIEQYETNESREARFNRLSNSYTELKKFLENDITNGKRLSAEELIKMLNDTEKLKELNVDRKALAKEIGDANLKELFKQKQAINKDDLIKHLLIGYGNHLKDKYNNKRTGAKGANPDMYDNIVNYMYYKAKQIPNQKFYHKATSLYRDITGNDYKTQFGRNGRGAENDSQEVLNRFISSVVGVPNGFDTKLNESFNETSLGKFAKEHYGDTFITDLMNRGMEATTIAKLGLFRPTAAIAQLGTLLNVYAKAGWNSNFRNALKDATMVKGSNVSMTEKKMFNEIGLDLENTSMETQTLSNRKSLYNLKVGKVRVGKLLEKSMATFNAADKYTRRVAALTAFRKAIKEGKSYDEAVMEASDFVRNTNFDYADKDASKLFTSAGTLGKMILQFKKYPVKEMEFMMDLFSKDERTEAERRREITRFLASYTVAAGIMGLPMLAVGDELAELLFGKTITGTAKDAMFSWAGKDPVKNNIARFLAYGALAPTMGVDFSRNIGLGDIVPTSDFAGPTLTTIGKMISSIREQKSMDDVVLAVAHDLSPAMGNYYQFMTGKQRDWKNGVDGREYSTGERLAKLAGFRTVKESVDSDMAYALHQKQTDEKNKKKALIYGYLENPSSVSKDEMRKYGIKGSDIKKAKEQIAKSKLERQEQYLPKKKRTEVTDTADKYNEFYEGL